MRARSGIIREAAMRLRTGRARSRSLGYAAALAALAAVFGAGWSRVDDVRSRDQGPARAVVTRQDFVETLRLHGTVEAVAAHTVVAPPSARGRAAALVLTKLVAAGTHVEAGDVLAELDAQAARKLLEDVEAAGRERRDDALRRSAEEALLAAQDERQLQEAAHAVEAARLDVRRNEILSRIEAEKNEQRLRVAEERLAGLREMADLRRRAGHAETRMVAVGVARAEAARADARRRLEAMTVRSPLAGLVVRSTIFGTNGPAEVREGQELTPGTAFLEVVDTRTMRVRVRVNQVDALKLVAGQAAVARLEAYPETAFSAHVGEVGLCAQAGTYSNRVREFTALVSIDGNDARLLPDLSAAVDVEIRRVPGVLVVPRDAVVIVGDVTFVRVADGPRIVRRAVTLGLQSDVEAVILSGLEAGTTVLRGPEAARGDET
jgi:HlyD family secretion protein